jgi:hypothetical protein
MTEIFPRRRRGRQSPAAEAIYQEQRLVFCDVVREIQSRLDFEVSSRGWAYIFENRGTITKYEIDICQALINDCRKSGELSLDICSTDESRKFENIEAIDETDPTEAAAAVLDYVSRAHLWYNPISFFDFQDSYIQMVVEKIDLRSLFEPVCEEYCVPIANAKGWADLNLRADMMKRFKYWESKGKRCVLLYCGDFDPAGIRISGHLRSNLRDMSAAVGWDPENLTIERFGLNHDFINANGLTWIDNLITAPDKASPIQSIMITLNRMCRTISPGMALGRLKPTRWSSRQRRGGHCAGLQSKGISISSASSYIATGSGKNRVRLLLRFDGFWRRLPNDQSRPHP